MKTTYSKMFLTLTFTALICLSAHAQYAYHITSGIYAYNSDWDNAVKLEFGVNATVADWQTIKAKFGGSMSTLNDFMTNSGFISYGKSAWVTVGGVQYESPGFAYFMERHDGTVPPGWADYDNMQAHTIDLGSWFNSRPIMARFPYVPKLDIRVSQMEICWQSATNQWYQLQYSSTLTTNQWLPLSTNWFAGDGTRFCTTDAVLVGSPQRFYRLSVTNTPPQ